jgi:hypothetical protein
LRAQRRLTFMQETHTVQLISLGSIGVTDCSLYVIAEARRRGNLTIEAQQLRCVTP